MPHKPLVITKIQFIGKGKAQIAKLSDVTKYFQYRDGSVRRDAFARATPEERAAHLGYPQDQSDYVKPAHRDIHWVDHGLGETYSQITRRSLELAGSRTTARLWIISPDPELMQRLPPEHRMETLRRVTEKTMTYFYDDNGWGNPDYSYVMHDKERRQDGLQMLHTHVVTPGTYDGGMAGRLDHVLRKPHLRNLQEISHEVFVLEMERALGKERTAQLLWERRQKLTREKQPGQDQQGKSGWRAGSQQLYDAMSIMKRENERQRREKEKREKTRAEERRERAEDLRLYAHHRQRERRDEPSGEYARLQAEWEEKRRIYQDRTLDELELARRNDQRRQQRAAKARRDAERLVMVRALGVSSLDLASLPPSRVKALAQYALISKAQAVKDLEPDRQMATLLAFAKWLEASAQDDALDLFDQLVSGVFKDAVKAGEAQRLRTLRDLDTAARHLKDACLIVINPACPDAEVRQRVFQQVPRATLSEAIEQVSTLTRPPDKNYWEHLADSYRSVRRYLPKLLATIEFQGLPISRPVREAATFLRALDAPVKPRPRINDAPRKIITSKWRPLVVERRRRINLAFYTFCFLHALQDGLRRRDLFVSPSERWRDPRARLLQGQAWREVRPRVCRVLGRSRDAEEELKQLGQQLDAAYQRTAANLATNPSVRIEPKGGRDRLVVSRLDALPIPDSLAELDKLVSRSIPLVDLPHLLLEIHAHTGFLDQFTHASELQARADDLPVSLSAVLMAEACNIPLDPLVQPDNPALNRDRLLWVQQNYLRPETLIQANARLVDAQTAIPLAREWGGGEVASADGLRFTVPVRTIHAEENPKYFGAGRGVTFLNFTSDQFTGFHGIVIPGAAREALYILDGLLEQQSSLVPTELMTDTAGYTDVVFGLFALLGYQYSPRLADIGKTRFWRIDKDADYGVLNSIARHRIKTELIIDHWDDLLRVAGSLKFGLLSASELMRTLRSGSKPSVLTKALQELGRISKTLYLLAYIDDESYRRRVLTQLNRGESRHKLARAIFFGMRGELRQRYRRGIEDQLGALGLVTNVVVLWNTLYMNAAVEHLVHLDLEVRPEDLARLSPLDHHHINFLGHYDFSLPEPIWRGQLRPLRDPFAENLLP